MRIIRYLKNCKVAVLLIVCLLVVQAFTDLALPHYTSDIVDVGIQQSGVEHAATDEMTAKTHDEIAMMLPVDDEQTFRDAYTETDDGTYKLNDQGKKEQEELDRMVALPLVAIHYSSQIWGTWATPSSTSRPSPPPRRSTSRSATICPTCRWATSCASAS